MPFKTEKSLFIKLSQKFALSPLLQLTKVYPVLRLTRTHIWLCLSPHHPLTNSHGCSKKSQNFLLSTSYLKTHTRTCVIFFWTKSTNFLLWSFRVVDFLHTILRKRTPWTAHEKVYSDMEWLDTVTTLKYYWLYNLTMSKQQKDCKKSQLYISFLLYRFYRTTKKKTTIIKVMFRT